MEEMKKDLNKIIEEHLPKQLGETLQKRLNELENVEEELKKSKEKIELLEKKDYDKEGTIGTLEFELRKTEKELADYINREHDLKQRENDVRFIVLERNLTLDRLNDFKEITNTVFRNSTVKKNIFVYENDDKVQSGSYDMNGNPIMQNNKNTTINETITEEE